MNVHDEGTNEMEVIELRCAICQQPLDNHRPWLRGLDLGEGAHVECLEGAEIDPEEDRP